MSEFRVAALIMSAGTGARFGGAVPKQYLPLLGVPPIKRALQTFQDRSDIALTAIVCAPGDRAAVETATAPLRADLIVDGGPERRDSVRNGLEALAARKEPPTHVLIHDAARPIIPAAVIDDLLEALQTAHAAAPALPLWDTLCRTRDGALAEDIPRAGAVARQTPQAFRLETILGAHRASGKVAATDDIALARLAGVNVTLTAGSPLLQKLTTGADKAMLERMLMAEAVPATGSGFDVHRFGPGAAVTLLGVEIPHEHGLVGHSDADVAMHALTDAILGTVAAGDIGQHFPPSDPQWRGAASDIFLKHAVALVAAKGGRLTHVDVTIICEAPKIGPHRERMQATLAPLLGLPPERINIKATTTEGLGFPGRGEGIAALASATAVLCG